MTLILRIFSAEKLRFALRVPLNGFLEPETPFYGTLRANLNFLYDFG